MVENSFLLMKLNHEKYVTLYANYTFWIFFFLFEKQVFNFTKVVTAEMHIFSAVDGKDTIFSICCIIVAVYNNSPV